MTTELYPKTPTDGNSSISRRRAKTRAILGPCHCSRFDVDHDFDDGCATFDGEPIYAPTIGSRPIHDLEQQNNGIVLSTSKALSRWVGYAKNNLSPSTAKTYETFSRAFLDSGLDTLPVDPAKLQGWLEGRGEPRSNTRNNAWRFASAFFGYIEETLSIPHPMKGLRRSRPRRIEARAFSFEETKDIDRAIKSDRERVIFTMYLCLGLRLSEGLGLTVGDVLQDRLRINKGKEGSEFVPITDSIRHDLLLLAQDKDDDDDALLGVKGDAVSGWAKTLYQRAGVSVAKGERIGVHVLRHTFMQLFQEAGGNPVAADRILRHADSSMLAHYSHWTLPKLRGQLQRFGPLTYIRQPLLIESTEKSSTEPLVYPWRLVEDHRNLFKSVGFGLLGPGPGRGWAVGNLAAAS